MPTDDRNVLDVLNAELNFLEKGGYGKPPRQPWRTPLIFEDSPACMNYDRQEHPEPCEECVLMQFVPPEARDNKIPCRFIPLTPGGDTLDSLYRWAEFYEVEDAMVKWLRATIQRLEHEGAAQKKETAAPRPA
jgi:hypothetical protein